MRSAAGPYVMPILEVDTDLEWYSMPLASHELTTARDGLGQEQLEQLALDVVRSVAEALRDFHAGGQVHRDLKPSNILCLEGRWVVTDFGIARNRPGHTTTPLTKTGGPFGTMGWAAPELHDDAHLAGPAADVYSVGAIVSWIVTGIHPAVVRVAAPDGAFRTAVTRATRNEASRRTATVDAMLAEMDKALTREGGPPSAQLEQILASPVDIGELSGFALAHRDNPTLLFEGLPELSVQGIAEWVRADADGLGIVLSRMSELLQDESTRGGLRQAELRSPLMWILDGLRQLVHRNQQEIAEHVAIAFFEAAEGCDQFPVNDAIGKWLKAVDDDKSAETIIRAAEVSTAEAYVRQCLERDWSDPQSRALRRWVT